MEAISRRRGLSIAPPRSFFVRSTREATRDGWIADPRFMRFVSKHVLGPENSLEKVAAQPCARKGKVGSCQAPVM